MFPEDFYYDPENPPPAWTSWASAAIAVGVFVFCFVLYPPW